MTQESEMKILAADAEDSELLLMFTFPIAATVAYVAHHIKNLVGVGNPYYAFHNSSVPSAVENSPGWDPSSAPICANDTGANETAILAMLADQQLQALPNDHVFIAT